MFLEVAASRSKHVGSRRFAISVAPAGHDKQVKALVRPDQFATREVNSTAKARADIQSKYTFEQADDLGKDYLQELRDAAIIQYR